ncbi:PREDICTED: protein ENHANCED DOWNY MILDEW 2 [Tarenaya hassleriana]|uniref:protein ENHANCED DOWNY MILDEW 2 n=1 Tax=Tarenaya hassleriana TaxID=28532 RepID=UPI00053C086C|nr:PREDICTED: protein ENHANCED DOWNY MILDEW 2 [Tarenaya hassleriana]XP_010536701.1 PREDICTED: protein ENHANCED DOWNY MILDEW 2 [Tarenaya hassleriana]
MAYVDDDDEEEIVPQTVSNYHFENDYKEPVSIAVLPVQWSDEERVDGSAVDVFLRGLSDNGLQSLYKPVKAWQFDLSNFKPEISVLTRDNIWIKLQKPRKSFEGLIRTILITLHSLHFIRRNPEASGKSLWEHLFKAFRSHDERLRPSQNDLVDHIDLISEAIKRDASLVRSKFLNAFVEKKPAKKRLPDEDNAWDMVSNFIVEDDMTEDGDEDDMDDDDDDYFESVCAICDNGGELLCCEGSCLRSFHATAEDGEESMCESLGLTKREVKEIQNFFCKNCEYKIHQCFICRKLGSSDKSTGAEVFRCVSATCVYFYHPRCVARRLHIGNQAEAEALEKRIAAGESFTCPLHKCCVCKQGEVKTDPKLQFAVCRRCPKSYHRKCLPREIAFEDIEEEDIVTRAWDGLLHNRVLIYCTAHEIDEDLGTPVRDHVKFPFTEEKKSVVKEQRKVSESHVVRDKIGSRVKDHVPANASQRKTNAKLHRNLIPASRDGASTKKPEVVSSVSGTMGKGKKVDPYKKSLLLQKRPRKMEVKEVHEGSQKQASLGMKLFNYMQDTEAEKPIRVVSSDNKHNKPVSIGPKEPDSELLTLDADSERRILALMKEASESITLEDIVKKRRVPSTHTSSLKHIVDKTITLGKVEGSVEAVKAALAKLVEGNNIEDAKAVCEPEVLNQIFKWKDKLKIYLAPFLYGPRYTSFGRHFTKVDKLQEIVDRLHLYAQDGDMIVDFCCGANDFSWLMKGKLEETGKKCLYKNYDLIQAKNYFNFEKRDWMTVRKEELPPGSRLIMGLNPPFGVKAALANKFINKALEFQPKLLILIVPVETDRLDKKKSPYVLVWEDKQFLSGKSFYLPGSVGDEDKQMDDWNLVSPPLSLWSRSDWVAKHMEIAQKHGHLSNNMGKTKFENDDHAANVSTYPVEDSAILCDGTSVPGNNPLDSYDENAVLANDDVSMEIDEPEVPDEVLLPEKGGDEILISEKGEETRGAKPCGNHQPNYLPREKKEKGKMKGNKSRRMMHEKSIDSSSLSRKSNNKEEESGESNREVQSIGAKMPERASDWRTSVRSSSVDDIYAERSHDSMEASNGGTRSRCNVGGNVGETDREGKSIRGMSERTLNRQISARFTLGDKQGASPSSSNVTAPRSHDPLEASHCETTRGRKSIGENVRGLDGEAQSSRGMTEKTWNRQISARSSRDDMYSVHPSSSNAIQRAYDPFEASYGGTMSDLHDVVGQRLGYGETYGVPEKRPSEAYMGNFPNEMTGRISYTEPGRGINAREQIRRYGQQAPDLTVSRDYLLGHSGHLDPISVSAPYGSLVSLPELPSYRMNNPPVMQQYPLPPRMGDLNYRRTNPLQPQLPPPPHQLDGNAIFDPRGPLPGPPGEPGDYLIDPMGFATGPHLPYTFGHSAGWIND